jgi:hypothetical protein
LTLTTKARWRKQIAETAPVGGSCSYMLLKVEAGKSKAARSGDR